MKQWLFAILLLTTFPSFSQTDKGDFLVGGNFGFRTNKNNSNFTFIPTGGYFVANNLAVGANLTIDFQKEGTVRSTDLGIGPFVRYYLGETKFQPFLVGSVGYIHSTIKENSTKIKTNGFYTQLGLGYAAFISDDVALEGIAAYNYTEYRNASSANGFSLNFGLQVYINKDKMSNLRRGRLE
jgi:hypothetical protein